MKKIICDICKNKYKSDERTIRKLWCDAVGFGAIPKNAIVHPICDKKEQSDIKAGKIKLSDLWIKKQ